MTHEAVAARAAEVLQRLLVADPEAMSALLRVRVPVNAAMAADPDLIVREHPDGTRTASAFGLIQAIAGWDDGNQTGPLYIEAKSSPDGHGDGEILRIGRMPLRAVRVVEARP